MFEYRLILVLLKRQLPTVFSLLAHVFCYAIIVLFFFENADLKVQQSQITSIQIDQLPVFTANEKPVEKNAAVEKRGGLIPAKQTTPDERPKGEQTGIGDIQGDVPVSGVPGNSGSGNGDGSGTSPGTDVYRVGVDTAPEAFGGIVAIQSKIPKNHPDYESSRGRTIYILVFVDESGIVRKAQVSKGLGNSLDAVIASIVRKTRFSPGKDKGKIVKTQLMMNIPIP